MDLLQSKGGVRRLLSLSTVLGALILSEGSGSFRGSRPAPPPARPPATAKKVPSPPAKSSPIRREFLNFYDQSGALSLAKGEVHAYSFDLEPDDFVDIEVEQQGLDVTADIYSPGKQQHVRIDRWNGHSGQESIPLLAKVPGHYKVELTGGGKGTYRILIPRKRKATVGDRNNSKGALAYWLGTELKDKQSEQAECEFRRALESWKASGFHAGQADAAYEVAKLLRDHEAWKEALPLFQQASALYRTLGNRRQEAVILNHLGIIVEKLGARDQAFHLLEEALAIARSVPAPEVEATTLFNRGRLYTESGEYGKALADLETALAWRRQHEAPADVAEALNALGRVYYLLEDPDSALQFHRQAVSFLRKDQNNLIIALTLKHMGDAYRIKGDFQRAESRYLLARNLLQGRRGHSYEQATILNGLGLASFLRGHNSEALSSFQQCQKAFAAQGTPEDVANAWTNIGWVLSSLNRFEDAAGAYRQAMSALRVNQQRPTEVAINSGLAWSEWRRGHLGAAQGYIARALQLMELLRTKAERKPLRTSFLAGRQDLYELQVEILMEQHRREPAKGYDLKAFEASERARSRSLLEDLEGRPVVPAISVRDIQKRVLDKDVVLLEYFLGDRKSFLWVVTRSTFASYELPARAQIEALARKVHPLMSKSNKREVQSTAIRQATALSRLLFGPVAGRLERKKLLIVSPPALQYISFGALPEDIREQGSRNGSWPTPWLFHHEIVVEPSAMTLETLRRLHEGRPAPPRLIAELGDPVFSNSDERIDRKFRAAPSKQDPFPRLRFSAQEAAAIQAEAMGKQQLWLGFDATCQRALSGDLKNYRNLHFSTHGILDQENHDRSALVLSLVNPSGKSIEGFLRAGEIAKLKLPADLVVLSACKTGLGREIRGEGLVGLTQAFFVAGASRVVVSLWNVDDQATSHLMGRFYHNLFQERLSPAASLKEAQVWMWRQRKWRAPAYWAGFVLQGEWQ